MTPKEIAQQMIDLPAWPCDRRILAQAYLDLDAEHEALRQEANRDLEDMRAFQFKFMSADHKLRDLDAKARALRDAALKVDSDLRSEHGNYIVDVNFPYLAEAIESFDAETI